MSFKYFMLIFPKLILGSAKSGLVLLTALLVGLVLLCDSSGYDHILVGATISDVEPVEGGESPFTTVVFKDDDGVEHEEYAFREPARGLPDHVLEMFCSSIKMRLYWNVYRDAIKEPRRKGIYLRRMARLVRHIFPDARDADKPFNATMLSVIDEYFGVKLDAEDKRLDKAIEARGDGDGDGQAADGDESDESNHESRSGSTGATTSQKPVKKLKRLKDRLGKKLDTIMLEGRSKVSGQDMSLKEALEEIDSSETVKQLESEGQMEASKRLKQFAKHWSPKVMLAIYTRWRTMWWMMMSCLFTKYYLWDPALEEFTKLKRNLVMWPDLQLVKMQNLQCKPLIFFRRLMNVCKILNPLMRIDFGQFDLDKLTRFKSDIN